MRSSRRLFLTFPAYALAITLVLKPGTCCGVSIEDESNRMAAAIATRIPARSLAALTFKNISSIPGTQAAEAFRLLKAQLRGRGVRLNAVGSERRATQVHVTLSENALGY